MAGRGARSEEEQTFYVERMCPEADHAYRLGFALTLSREGAWRVASGTFKKWSGGIRQLMSRPSEELRLQALRLAWQEFQSIKGENFTAENSKLAQFFASLPLEARAALMLVDVIGMTVNECAEITGQKPGDITRQVAQARRDLVNTVGISVKSSMVEEAADGPEDP